MSRLPEYCECSKPNSQKHCRIACGKPRHPNIPLTVVFDFDDSDIPEDIWEILKEYRERNKRDG